MQRNNRASLRFHIIHIPGTVRNVVPLVDTLLHRSDYTFDLVANGCRADEDVLSRKRCSSEPRRSWWALPWPLKHDGPAVLHLGSYSIYAGERLPCTAHSVWIAEAKQTGCWLQSQITVQAYHSSVLRQDDELDRPTEVLTLQARGG